ncbi:MAG: sulfatase [Draconibacterium sp.]
MKKNNAKRVLISLLLTGLVTSFSCLAKANWRSSTEEISAVKKPNIIWITCEDISPYIECYGDELVKTPNIDQLAKEGVKFNAAYTTAGVCAPSRSAIVTGMYQTSIGTMHMRTSALKKVSMGEGVPNYNAVIPGEVKCFPEYLRRAGYYTSNNQKTDYQFEAPVTVWDDCSAAASYKNRPEEKPFFSVFNIAITHESQIFHPKRTEAYRVNPEDIKLPAFYMDTKTVRADMARLFTNIEIMDDQVGEIIQQLKNDGLYDDSYIFFYSDHGGALPWMKREVLERGIHIPLVIKYPKGKHAGGENNDLVSSVDFAPTVLSLAGIEIPDYMQGQAFLGGQKSATKRKYVFAARDRMDARYDRVRVVRDGQFEYLYNYMPEKPYYQDINYRLNIPMMKEIIEMKEAGTITNPYLASWFEPKPKEELYDVKNDPDQLHNLAGDSAYAEKLNELRTEFWKWTMKVGDMGALPEKEMVYAWWNGQQEAPTTAEPIVQMTSEGAIISCSTDGASIGYKVIKSDEEDVKIKEIVKSWCFGPLFGSVQNGQTIEVDSPWQVYNGQPVNLDKGDKLIVNAMRIGYQPTIKEFENLVK